MNSFLKLAYQTFRMLLLIFKPHTVGVRILLIEDDKVLLVKHTYQDEWYIPGGMVERGESLESTVRREAFEELGAQLENLELFGAYSNLKAGKNDFVIVFLSRQFHRSPSLGCEISEVSAFPLDNLPEDISPGSSHRIEEFLSGVYPNFGTW